MKKSAALVASIALESGLFALSGLLAFLLRFEFSITPRVVPYVLYAIPIWVVVKTVVMRTLVAERGVWIFFSVRDLGRLILANIAGSLLSALFIIVLAPAGSSRSVFLIDLMTSILLTTGTRALVR